MRSLTLARDIGGILLVAVGLLACGESDEPQPSTSSDSGGSGGGDSLVPPEAGLPDLECPPGERPLDDGTCQPAGIPAASCGEYFEPVGGSCRAILPADPCPSGTMAVPGDTACHEPAPCGDGTWGDIPVEADTQYVDDSYGGSDADGSSGKPWPTVQQGIAAAAAGAIVAVAEGTYDEALTIYGKAVRLWGVCPAKTEIANVSTGGVAVHLRNAHGSEVHNLAISGVDVGFQQNRTTDVLMEGVWLHDLGFLGIDVERGGGDVSITIRDTLVERSSQHGVFFYGAEVTVERFVVRQTRQNADGLRGRGIALISEESTGIPTRAQLRRVVSSDQYWFGIDLFGSEAVIEDSLVADIAAEASTGSAGTGIMVEEDDDNSLASSLTLRRVEIARTTECGIYLRSSSVDAEALVIRDTTPSPALVDSGFGIAVSGQGQLDTTLQLRDAWIEDNVGYGVAVIGAEATIEGAVVLNTTPLSNGGYGRGISFEYQGTPAQRASGAVVGSWVDGAAEAGIAILGADATLDSVMVTDEEAAPRGDISYGILIQEELSSGEIGAAQIQGALVDSVEGIGIGVLGAEATIYAAHVRNTRVRTSDEQLGRGILVQAVISTGALGRGTIDGCLVEGSADSGIAVGGSTVDIVRTVVRDTRGVDGLFGDGVMNYGLVRFTDGVVTSNLPTLTRIVSSHIDGAARAGVASFATTVTLEDTLVSCSPFALNGEPFQHLTFSFTDEGNNRCGCNGVVESCAVVSNGLAPPTPVDP